jgi:hypothetical protein
MHPKSELLKVVAEFREVVDGIYGTFLVARDGFWRVRESMVKLEKETTEHLEGLGKERPELANLPYGGSDFSYGRFVPAGSQPRYRHLHQVSTETIKQRNEEGGSNSRFTGNVCLVTLYQYWEDNYRGLLADVLGARKNQIQVPIFGEIAKYRHAILHNRGVATSDVEECAIFKWYKKGDQVLLDREKFEEIIDAVFQFLANVEKEPEQFVKRA